MRTYF